MRNDSFFTLITLICNGGDGYLLINILYKLYIYVFIFSGLNEETISVIALKGQEMYQELKVLINKITM